MKAWQRFLVVGGLAASLILLAGMLSFKTQADDEVYAITDVQVTDDRQAIRSDWMTHPDYTGVTRHNVTLPFVPDVHGSRSKAFDVNTGIGGTTTTIWVKYERLRRDSGRSVLVDIAVSHWPNWRSAGPDPEFRPANGYSAKIKGALTTGTKGSAFCNGLMVKFNPLRESPSWVLGLYLHCSQNNVPWVPVNPDGSPLDAIEGLRVKAERAGIDIHKGAGGSYYHLIKLSTTEPEPVAGQTYVWRDLFEQEFHGGEGIHLYTPKIGYRQINAFQYGDSAYLVGSKIAPGDKKEPGYYPYCRMFYVSRIKSGGAGWEKNIGYFKTPALNPNSQMESVISNSCWALFSLDNHPYLAALFLSGAEWHCAFLKYQPDTHTFMPIGNAKFAGWGVNVDDYPHFLPITIGGEPYLLAGTNSPGKVQISNTRTRLYRIRDICGVNGAGEDRIGHTWSHLADVRYYHSHLFEFYDLGTLVAFQQDGRSYLFGRLKNQNEARIMRFNEQTWGLEGVANKPFPLNTFLVLPFQADHRHYLFSLDDTREFMSFKHKSGGTGNIWRIKDDLSGWERVYWADHRGLPQWFIADPMSRGGYARPVCTTFELNGTPYMFMKYLDSNWPLADKSPAYIVSLERRNWIRVMNSGGYVAKFYIQYQENGKTVMLESGEQNVTYEKVWHLPPETRTVLLNAQGHTGFKWNVIHRGNVSVNCTYTVGGTAPAQWLRVANAAGEKASF
jgi:hypothetical protein